MQQATLVSVVEDDPFFRESMRRLMRSLDYRVEVFSSPTDFLSSSHLSETTCLIADVQMPVMSGFDLHRSLMEAGRTIPTILVTAYPNDVDRVRAINDGIVCYLRKPIDETRLTQCLRDLIGFHENS